MEQLYILLHHESAFLASILLNNPPHLREIGSGAKLMHHWRMPEKPHDLAGKTVLVTRTEEQATATGRAIAGRGGTALFLPCLELERLDENIRSALPMLQNGPASVLFTSSNGVHSVAEALGHAFALLLKPHRLIAIGERTGEALAAYGMTVDMEPDTASQDGLIDLLKRTGRPDRLLFFRAEEGGDSLAEELGRTGSKVTTIHAYRMRCPDSDASSIITRMQKGEIDAVLLGSAKTAENYLRRIGSIETANIPAIAVISPQVAAAAEKAGLRVRAVAKIASFDAMLDALSEYFKAHGA